MGNNVHHNSLKPKVTSYLHIACFYRLTVQKTKPVQFTIKLDKSSRLTGWGWAMFDVLINCMIA